jgi:8-oxo-dGTP pyrophosphatase MutT (NUDIX family)
MTIPVYFAQKAFILDNGRILAVRRDSTDENHPCRWEVPGGRLEADETLDAHLVREVFEETSLMIKPGPPFFLWKWTIKQAGPSLPNTIVAVGRLCSLEGGRLSDGRRVVDDHLDLMEWLPLDRLHTYDWIPNMLPVLDALRSQLKPSRGKKGASIA